MTQYRVLRDEPSYDAKKGEEVDLDLSAEQESELLAAKRIEIVPRLYKVIGSSVVDDTNPDGEFESAMTLAREALLVAGGHIARVDKPKSASKAKKEEVK